MTATLNPGLLPVVSNHEPVSAEIDAFDLPVIGSLPAELDGRLLRIGPNPTPLSAPGHLFAGEGMVHGIRLREGRAEWYRNRWVRTARACRALGEAEPTGPRHGLSDNANTNVVTIAGKVYAVADSGVLPIELDEDLGTVARSDFGGTLPAGFTAHPQTDPFTGETFGVAYYHDRPYAQYVVLDREGRVRKVERIAVTGTPMMHAFALTASYVVLFDLPVRFSAEAAAEGSRWPYRWDHHHGARVGLLPREGAGHQVRWFDVAPSFVFHTVNAYDLPDGEVVVDVVRHQRVFDRDPGRPSESRPELWRWTLSPHRSSVVERKLFDDVEEFPRIDDRRRTSAHRYSYGVAMGESHGGALAGYGLLKHDMITGSTIRRVIAHAPCVGEPVFVPRSANAAEDDGWVLTVAYDAGRDASDLIVLDAQDFAGDPVAVVRLPGRVPDGFHAAWVPSVTRN